MAEDSKITWCDHTVNFWWGCTKVSPACTYCYAMGQANRFQVGLWGQDGARRIRVEAAAKEALRYQRRAVKEGTRCRIFGGSMSDFFEDRPDLLDARTQALDVIRQTPNLDWLILTKRPEKIDRLLLAVLEDLAERDQLGTPLYEWISVWRGGFPPCNVWLGTTVEDQEHADKRIPALLEVPAAVRFLSCEPLLGPVNLHRVRDPNPAIKVAGTVITFDALSRKGGIALRNGVGLDWVICGGESGPSARPLHPEWARNLRDQCGQANVPFLFKQWGEWIGAEYDAAKGKVICQTTNQDAKVGRIYWTNPGSPRTHIWGHRDHYWDYASAKVGKAHSGRILDGVLHDGYPDGSASRASMP